MLYEMKNFHFYYQWKIPYVKLLDQSTLIFFMAFDSQSAFQKDRPNHTFSNNVYKCHHHTLAWNNLFNTLLLIMLVIKWNLDVLTASVRWLWWQTRRLEMFYDHVLLSHLKAHQNAVRVCLSLGVICGITHADMHLFPTNDSSWVNAWHEAGAVAHTSSHKTLTPSSG